MIKLKKGATLNNMHPMIWWLLGYLEGKGISRVVTSGDEPVEHSVPNSKHYCKPAEAVDLRSRGLDIEGIRNFMKETAVLDEWFDRVIEGNHIHMEWDPHNAPLFIEEVE